MKKKLFPLVGGVAVLAILLGVYAYKSGSDGDTQIGTEPTTEETTQAVSFVNSGQYTLCDKSAENIRDIKITAGENQLVLKYSAEGYTVDGYEGVDLNMSNTASIASTFLGLYSDNKIEESDRQQYGLATPLATGVATYEDGSSLTLTLGNLTADKKYYYMESSETEGIYLVDAIVGGRLLYTINDLVDTTIATIKPNYTTYIEVINSNGDELLMYFDEEKSNANKNFASQGLSTLTMEKPLEGATVYPYNLTDTILRSCSSLTLNQVIEAKPADYGIYGLDKPNMTVRLKDNSGSLEIKVGSQADENNVYVTVNDSISVFTMNKSLLEPFESYTITDFIEKFVAFHMRNDIHSVQLESEFGDFTLDFKAEGENKIITDEEGKVTDKRLTILNGKAIEGDDFINFYELLAGLTFDQISDHTEKSGTPSVTLTYTLLDGTTNTTEFYNYNDNFYCVGSEGKYDMLVNKQSVKQIVDKAKALS